jgi:SAM-dependent methyltransferase
MPLLSTIGRDLKLRYFLRAVPKDAQILEIGSAEGWLGKYLKENGWKNYIGLDLMPGADIVGDLRDWKKLGLKANSFDVIFAFEVLEHVPCFQECFDLLKPGGYLMATSPVPHMDWLCQILENLGLNQKRTSPHDYLIYFREIPLFEPVAIKTIAIFSQWGIFRKSASALEQPQT